MASSKRESRLNEDIRNYSELLKLATSADVVYLLEELNFDWGTGKFEARSALGKLFVSYGWAASDGKLDRIGRLVLSRLSVHLDGLAEHMSGQLARYTNIELVRRGKNSIIYRGRHAVLGNKVILKFIRPGASDNLTQSLQKVLSADLPANIIRPNDLFSITVEDLVGQKLEINCLVFPEVDGKTLTEFLNDGNAHLIAGLVGVFIRQIGGALKALEDIGAYHGDIHNENILVSRNTSGVLEFNLLDISYDAVGSSTPEQAHNNDLEEFVRQTWRLITAQRTNNPRLSLRKFLGTDLYLRVEKVLNGSVGSFSDVMRIFHDHSSYGNYIEAKQQFLKDKFHPPGSFRLQRYEEFTNPADAVNLFVPLPELEEKVRKYGNMFISGTRGSGKSTYLASLAFFPSVANLPIDFRETYGVYFPCRQGEFRTIRDVARAAELKDADFAQHVLVLKIARRVLESLLKGIQFDKLNTPIDIDAILGPLCKFIPGERLEFFNDSPISILESTLSMLVQAELTILADRSAQKIVPGQLCGPLELLGVLQGVKTSFVELASTQFHILFDDAGKPFVPSVVQRAICDLMLSSNSTFCVKLTAEKFTFTFKSNEGKSLEAGHDYIENDISHTLYIGGQNFGLPSTKLSEYFQRIVDERLRYFKFASDSVIDYLGEGKGNHDRLLLRLVSGAGRKSAIFSGWETVWHIADRTPRTLLEVVAEIFSEGGVTRQGDVFVVREQDQNRAIRNISEKRLQQLGQVSGKIELYGKEVSLGKHIHHVTTTLGSAFRAHLMAQGDSTDTQKKPRQILAIERNDIVDLSSEAEETLRKLVTLGILDDSKEFAARDDRRIKPIYVLNRVFCPAFSIGYHRDDNLKLSIAKFEQLLTHPNSFRRAGTTVLRALTEQRNEQGSLFDKDRSNDEK